MIDLDRIERRIGQEFDGELTLDEKEARSLLAELRKLRAVRDAAVAVSTSPTFAHQRRALAELACALDSLDAEEQ